MSRWWKSLAAMSLALGLVASVALVQDRPAAGRARGRGVGMRGGRGGGMLPDLTAGLPGLTDAQKADIAKIRQAVLARIQDLQKKMNSDIKRLLTPEQVKAMEQAQRRRTHRGPGGITMTDEQKVILDAARAEAAKVTDPDARRKILRDASDKIQASYTDEQKKEAEERRARRGRGGRRQRNPGANE